MINYQQELLPVEHRSLQQRRLKKYGRQVNAERFYAAEWKRANKRRPGVNSGYSILEHILTPDGNPPRPVSQRDAEVAASVIQWLGTNCGLGFVNECERKIEEAHLAETDRAIRARLRAQFQADLEKQKPRRVFFDD